MSLPHATIPTNLRRRAFRRSCDRCHAQKLKCTGSNANLVRAQCQRCQQAGLRCVYSERLPKRNLHKEAAAGTTRATETSQPMTATSSTVFSSLAETPPPYCSPPTHIGTSALKETLSEPSAATLQFYDTSINFDDPESFPGGWPQPNTFRDDANSNESSGIPDLGYDFEGPLDATAPVSPSLFDLEVEGNSSSGQSNTSNTQRDLFESLSDVSQDLEVILHGVTVEWPKQKILSCEIFNSACLLPLDCR